MRSITPRGLATLLLPAAILVGVPRTAEAVLAVSLNAASFPMPMPDTSSVTMWGFGRGAAGAPTVPGPPIVVPVGETVLDVTLTNNLTVPVSFVILGQAAPSVGGVVPGPTFVDSTGAVLGTGSRPAGNRDARIRSFTQETQPGATVTYRFSGLRPGTYLYESGTHQAVQVQMGLYGAMTQNSANAAAGPPPVLAQAYPGVSYDTQQTLLYSEVDPALHAAVAGGTYGTPAYPSTFAYAPQFFLVNGAAYVAGTTAALPAGNANGATLLRLLNAGLSTHVPTLLGGTLRLVAEDGNAYPHARQQYSAPLPAGKTTDAIFTAPAAGDYPLFDRALALMNGASTDGGLRTVLSVAAAAGPTAVADAYSTAEDEPLVVAAAAGVLANDDPGLTALLETTTAHGILTFQSSGGFTYSPTSNYNGTDSFTYRATDGVAQSAPATVTITVTPANDTPVAVADPFYSATTGIQLAVGSAAGASPQGVLLNDSDIDGDALTATLTGGPSGGTLSLQPNGSFTFTAASAGVYTFSYAASDGTAASSDALVTITVTNPVNHPPVAVNDAATTRANVTVDIPVLANDSDPDGPLPNAASSVVIVTRPLVRYGSVTIQPNGQIRFVPYRNFRGTAVFTYKAVDTQGATSNTATVRVSVVK